MNLINAVFRSAATAAAALALSLAAHANEPAAAAAKPDLKAGEAKAQQVCSSCHAVDGSRGVPTFPILQGQHAKYLATQLEAFKKGQRKGAQASVMAGQAATLTDADIRNVSAFFASKQAKPGSAKNSATVRLGEKIYRGGIAEKQVPACAGCHGPTGSGIPDQFPRLGGQHAEYTKSQLAAFQVGDRKNGNGAMMVTIAARLSTAEIEAVADYIAGLH